MPHRHRPGLQLQPAHELQVDRIREPREQRRPMARQPRMHDELVLWYAGRVERGYVRRDPSAAADHLRNAGLSGAFWGVED